MATTVRSSFLLIPSPPQRNDQTQSKRSQQTPTQLPRTHRALHSDPQITVLSKRSRIILQHRQSQHQRAKIIPKTMLTETIQAQQSHPLIKNNLLHQRRSLHQMRPPQQTKRTSLLQLPPIPVRTNRITLQILSQPQQQKNRYDLNYYEYDY